MVDETAFQNLMKPIHLRSPAPVRICAGVLIFNSAIRVIYYTYRVAELLSGLKRPEIAQLPEILRSRTRPAVRALLFAAAQMMNPGAWTVLPFIFLLSLIALAPLFFANWWGGHYGKVACGLGLLLILYYVVRLHATDHVITVACDYARFIALIGSLFVVSGGIHITVKGEATPLANVTFLLLGAILSNLLGTTGASMLLIRPWLRMNKYRITGHHIIFFIFIISNVGGCLTPIGDPPLYLGYLKGIPFWWVTEQCWAIWATAISILLLMFLPSITATTCAPPKSCGRR